MLALDILRGITVCSNDESIKLVRFAAMLAMTFHASVLLTVAIEDVKSAIALDVNMKDVKSSGSEATCF